MIHETGFKGPVAKIYGDLLAEMEYNIHKYVLISVLSPENKNCVFVTLEWALYIYMESRSSSMEPDMFLQ